MFRDHYYERLPENIETIIKDIRPDTRRLKLLKRLEKNCVSKDGKILDVSLIPRIIPSAYKKEIEDTCRIITKILLGTLYDNNINHKLNGSKLANTLKECKVLENLPEKLIGSARYDLAAVGPLEEGNPPKLIELNLLDYGGMGWLPRQAETYLSVFPELEYIVEHNNISEGFSRNLPLVGKNILMIVDGQPKYEDYELFREEMQDRGLRITTISSQDFSSNFMNGSLKLNGSGAYFDNKHYDVLHLKSFSTEEEVETYKEIVNAIINLRVPMYEHFGLLLLEDKGIISELSKNRSLTPEEQKKLTKMIPKNMVLTKNFMAELKRNPDDYVLKNRTSHMGRAVYIGNDMLPIIEGITTTDDWCVQERYKLNKLDSFPINGENRPAITDLACYVNYVYHSNLPEEKRLTKFEVIGVMSRASQRSHLVNIAQGGFFVPTYFEFLF